MPQQGASNEYPQCMFCGEKKEKCYMDTPSNIPLSCRGQITLSKTDEICPLASPNQISLISMHVPSLVKIPWHLLKLLVGKENMSLADNTVKIWRNWPISNPKPDLHKINAHTKFGENPFPFPQVIIRKRNRDGWTYNWQTDRHTGVQRETIIPTPRLLCGGYKNP